jgi:catechol 2,3-dioxygenase-like lactoylglutathione lyase family enzyme
MKLATWEQVEEQAPPVRAVRSIGMTVANLDRSVAFYRNVLRFNRVGEEELWGPELERLTGLPAPRARVARMRLGDELLELTEYLTPRGRPFPVDSRSNDHWFQHVAIIVRDMDEAYARLRQYGVENASEAPQQLPDWNRSAGGIRAFYFRDSDGHFLELLQFPPEKGQPRWHLPTNELFLGIDHTAVVVHSTQASVSFYRDRLGMMVVGRSENHGPEQERLNNLAGARLRITTLRASAGPGIELLEYLTPRSGRRRPTDARANDVLHWHTTVEAAGVNCRRRIADPDGHVVELVPRR